MTSHKARRHKNLYISTTFVFCSSSPKLLLPPYIYGFQRQLLAFITLGSGGKEAKSALALDS